MNKSEIAAAFVARMSGRCHNAHTDGESYTLHDSVIARHTAAGLLVDFCGYFTPTTASHINGILRAAGKPMRVSYAQARDRKAPARFVC